MFVVVQFIATSAFCMDANKENMFESVREKVNFNKGWRFYKYDSIENADNLIYDIRPEVKERKDYVPADAMPTEAVEVASVKNILKPWILPTGNEFLKDTANKYTRPEGDPGADFSFVQNDFDDSSWQQLDLPHDWAINGPFYQGWGTPVGGGMGRLPSPGVAWYRKKFTVEKSDIKKSVFLEVDGAMSYAMVWINGHIAGGWPYGYSSWQVDLTPYIKAGLDNQVAIRVDNPSDSSRWYPGGGIYRNVWLTKTQGVHVSHWGTYITTPEVSRDSAIIELEVGIDNDTKKGVEVLVSTDIFELDKDGSKFEDPVASIKPLSTDIAAGNRSNIKASVKLANPKLWGPLPTQKPNLYLAVTSLSVAGQVVDCYETRFGIRSLRFEPDSGIYVNGDHIQIKGANQHHDLGPLGAAFNISAAKRQLQMLQETGCNAIRMSHNPPAPELLELTDEMGLLVVDEVFDVWERKKTPLDFHLIFPDWHEQDLRAMIRRDRNHPSVIIWSYGDEVGEQYTGDDGAEVSKKLHNIVKDEDPTRPTTVAMNYAKPHMPMPATMDIIALNYQGEGIRNAPAYAGLKGINTHPIFPDYHQKLPGKVIISSENAAALSSRGTYLFPVTDEISAPVQEGFGGDGSNQYVSSYELYTADFGSSADKVFRSLDKHPYVAGGFVWSGWDYLGEPTPYYSARSSYFGIIDLAGFKKDRFFLYQSYWRPDFPMAHILPHWTWPDRIGEVTPVHVFTSGDEAELFLNGKSLGRKTKGKYQYRLRWDDVKYQPGVLEVIAYKKGQIWAADTVRTAGKPASLELEPDRTIINSAKDELAFITVRVTDDSGIVVPEADILLKFSIEGPGEITATANGDPTNMTSFGSHERKAFNGYCLVIVRGIEDKAGEIKLIVKSEMINSTSVALRNNPVN